MEVVSTRSTSANTAAAEAIVLRLTEQVRLVFVPTIIRNPHQPDACVKGCFVYQRKAKRANWEPITESTLASLRAGEGYKLELHSAELLTLRRGLRPLYQVYRQTGIPHGTVTFVKLEAALARFLALSEPDLESFLDRHKSDAIKILLKIVRWLACSTNTPEVAAGISSAALSQLPKITALLGLASIKEALVEWEKHRNEGSEEFWQQALSQRAYVLSQLFAYPIVVISKKAYVGGKTLDNIGGNVVDFLFKAKATDGVGLIEIKTPMTKLLGPMYRKSVYPPSSELSGAVAQALTYRQTLMTDFHSLNRGSMQIVLGEPRCVVIVGDASRELNDQERRNCFELYRERLQGITIVTYDELFQRLRGIVSLLESPLNVNRPAKAESGT